MNYAQAFPTVTLPTCFVKILCYLLSTVGDQLS